MISTDTRIIGKLTGNHVLVARNRENEGPDSGRAQTIEKLKNRDREVRLHESIHSANPELIKLGAAEYSYTIGPDGKPYATGGKVTLSTGNPKSPEDAMAKAGALRKASMAPGEPSSMDFQARNSAIAMEFEAGNLIYSAEKKLSGSAKELFKGSQLNFYA